MSNNELKASPLRAGAARVDITPKMGMHLEGNIGVYRPALFVNDPIYAKALVLEAGGRKLCILSLDLLAVTLDYVDEIRRQATEEYGFDADAVMVHDTQTHSSPGLGHFMFEDSDFIRTAPWWANAGDEAYAEYVMPKVIEAIGRANEALEPAVIGAGSGIDGRSAYNRRYVMRDGMVKTNAGTADPQIRYVEGPADPEVGVVCVSTEEMRIISMLLHHTCHPTHLMGGDSTNSVSADWPGAWCDEMGKRYGDGLIPQVINGCCGNVLHRDPLDPTWVSDYRRMGRLLAETSEGVLREITYENEVVLDWRSRHLKIPMRELDAREVEEARSLLEEHPDPIWLNEEHTRIHWDWMYAIGKLLLHRNYQRDPYFDYEIQVFRLGDIALLAIPGEPFVEGQLEIKLKSPTYPTYVVHHSNAYVGYVPTKDAFPRGGYETWAANWVRLVPEALDMIVENAVELLGQVFSDSGGSNT